MNTVDTSETSSKATIQKYLGLIRFSHTIFALPFALLAATLAWHGPALFRWQDLFGILLCMVFARSAAMAFNRFADQKIDAENPRTATRHIPSGQLTSQGVLIFTILSCLCFVLSTLIFLPNRWPLILAVPVLAFLLGYSYIKRFSMFAHYWLAAALMLSPIATWIAITGSLTWTPVALAAVIFFWVGGFDIIYACQDAQYDRDVGLHSIPAKLGITGALRFAALSHLLCLVSLILFWKVASLGMIFLTGVILVAGLLIYEHLLVKPNDLSRAGVAFFQINALISIGLLLVGIADLWLG